MLNICNNIFIYIINNIFIYLTIYSWNPNGPCFGWKRPCFEGVYPKKMQVISVWALDRYIYVYIYSPPSKERTKLLSLFPCFRPCTIYHRRRCMYTLSLGENKKGELRYTRRVAAFFLFRSCWFP